MYVSWQFIRYLLTCRGNDMNINLSLELQLLLIYLLIFVLVTAGSLL